MAKINFGGVVQDARGKQNGLVYSKNGSGSYVRRKVTPVNPNTLAQQLVRGTFANLSQAWSGLLTDAQRAEWTSFAKTYPIRDVFGASITLNGLNMFVRVNAVLVPIPETMLLDPPAAPYTVPIPVDPTTFTVTLPSMTFEMTAAAAATDLLFYIFATKPLPPGRTSVKSDYRLLGTFGQGAGTYPRTIDLGTAYVAKFGSSAAGLRVSILVSTLDPNIGIPTVGIPMSAIGS